MAYRTRAQATSLVLVAFVVGLLWLAGEVFGQTPAPVCTVVCVTPTPAATRTTVALATPTPLAEIFQTATGIAQRGTPPTPTAEDWATPVTDKSYVFLVTAAAGLRAYECPSMQSFSTLCVGIPQGIISGSLVTVPMFGDVCERDRQGYTRVKVFDPRQNKVVWVAWFGNNQTFMRLTNGTQAEFTANLC